MSEEEKVLSARSQIASVSGNSIMFLTREEVAILTGYKLYKKQCDWLTKNGVKFWVDRSGKPQVPASAINTAAEVANTDAEFELEWVA